MKNKANIKKLVVLHIIFLIIGVLLILSIKFDLLSLLPTCVFRQHYGVICPTCGVTRCTINFCEFNFKQSFLYHPTFFIGMVYIILIDIAYIINTIFNRKFLKQFYPSISILCIFLTMHVVQYMIRMCMLVLGVGLEYL